MSRRALIVGLDHYHNFPQLNGCGKDGRKLAKLIASHEDGSANYECRLLTHPPSVTVSRAQLRLRLEELFRSHFDDVLFFFSGHGQLRRAGGFLVTSDGDLDDPGFSMDELIALANTSGARSILIILDCCYSGNLANPISLTANLAVLRQGLTILGASRSRESAAIADGQGVFTRLILSALRGAAADVRGEVSSASLYSFVDPLLGAWDQRPVYKAHTEFQTTVRRCTPSVPDALLLKIRKLFRTPTSRIRLNPSYEETSKHRRKKNVRRFKMLKILRDSRLVRVVDGDDLYFAAMKSKPVQLTELGRFYWHWAQAQSPGI